MAHARVEFSCTSWIFHTFMEQQLDKKIGV